MLLVTSVMGHITLRDAQAIGYRPLPRTCYGLGLIAADLFLHMQAVGARPVYGLAKALRHERDVSTDGHVEALLGIPVGCALMSVEAEGWAPTGDMEIFARRNPAQEPFDPWKIGLGGCRTPAEWASVKRGWLEHRIADAAIIALKRRRRAA